MTTRPLTTESEATVKALAGMSADAGMEVWLRKRMEMSEAAAIARFAEGLVERVARGLHQFVVRDRYRDMDFVVSWDDELNEDQRESWREEASRILAIPEAQEADRG